MVIPYRDRSFNRGDGCFDMTRTFDGRIFRLEEHVERLYRSLSYLGIDIGLEPKEMIAITEEVVERNEPLRPPSATGGWPSGSAAAWTRSATRAGRTRAPR